MADDELFVDQNDVEGTASGVWSRMLAGNRRFAEGRPEHPNRSAEAREALIDTHEPDAAVLCCSDARVSPDIIFDAGIGDLFTVRTAGQVIDNAVIASLDYAVDVLGVRLLVVLEVRCDQTGRQGIRRPVAQSDRQCRGFAHGSRQRRRS